MEMEDKSGTPRPDEEIARAIELIKKFIVRDPLRLPPELFVEFACIKEGLSELLALRRLVKPTLERLKKMEERTNKLQEQMGTSVERLQKIERCAKQVNDNWNEFGADGGQAEYQDGLYKVLNGVSA